MRLLKLNASDMTKSEVITHSMQISRFGALSQIFIIDAMDKNMASVPERKLGEYNDKLVARVMRSKAGAAAVVAAVTVQAEGCEKAGLEGVCAAFDKSGASQMINPAAWHGVALEILGKLRAAS